VNVDEWIRAALEFYRTRTFSGFPVHWSTNERHSRSGCSSWSSLFIILVAVEMSNTVIYLYIIIFHWFGLNSSLPPKSLTITAYALHFGILSYVINIITVSCTSSSPARQLDTYFNILFTNLTCGDFLNVRRAPLEPFERVTILVIDLSTGKYDNSFSSYRSFEIF